MEKSFTIILFNKEIDFIFYNFWKIRDEEGDFYFPFKVLDLVIGEGLIGITVLNFGVSINWWN